MEILGCKSWNDGVIYVDMIRRNGVYDLGSGGFWRTSGERVGSVLFDARFLLDSLP
jgi:hypothetical protein